MLQAIQALILDSKGSEDLLPCTDDLLSLMVVMIGRSGVTNLSAHAAHVEHFLFFTSSGSHKGELGYHLTNFYAATEYAIGHAEVLRNSEGVAGLELAE